MKKFICLTTLLLIFCTSNANAKKRRNEKYVFGVTMLYDHARGDSLVPLDSIKHLIDTKQIDYLFLPNNPLVGLHFNSLVQGGDSNAPTEASWFGVPLDGGHGCINDTDGIGKLLAYISEQNCLGKTNIQVRGFDFSFTDGTYFAFTCHTPPYDYTTIPDSLELYHDVHMHESHECATQIAVRTATLIRKNKKKMKGILKEEYEIWEKYINELARLAPNYMVKMTDKKRDSLLFQDFLWMNKLHPGNKIIICSQTLGEQIIK